jgi:hypothetical protein
MARIAAARGVEAVGTGFSGLGVEGGRRMQNAQNLGDILHNSSPKIAETDV